jgi:tetratricopeptide (TPR) repeat protein
VERHRESAVLYFNLGRYAYDSGDRDRALEMYRTSLDLDPSQTLAWNSVGIIEMDLGQYEGALESFKKVLAIEESPVYLHNATNCLVNLRRFDEAMAYAEKGLQKDGSEEYCDSMAGLFRGLGRWEEAERIVAKGLEAHPLSKELGRTQAAILSATGDVAGAVALLREIDLKNPGDAGVLFDLAGLLENSGRIAQAEALHKRAMKADPRNRYLGLAYGKFLVRQGQLPKADRVFRDLLQASPSPDPDAAEEILDHWLTAYGESGKNREGLALLDGLEPEFPGLSLFPLFRGLFLKANGEIEKAMEFFEKGLDTMPRLVLHIVECLQKMGRHAECVERMDEVLEKDPDWVDGRVKLVEILLECGELEWAEDEIARLSTRPVSETLLEDLRSRLEEKRLGSQEN